MQQGHVEKLPGFLFRMRKQDTPTGVSSETVEKLTAITGLTKTEVVHLALRQMANKIIPHYELDDRDLSDEQLQAVREMSPATSMPDSLFNRKLFR